MILHDSFLFFNDFDWVNFISLILSPSVKQGNGTRRFFKAPQPLEIEDRPQQYRRTLETKQQPSYHRRCGSYRKDACIECSLDIDVDVDIDRKNMLF